MPSTQQQTTIIRSVQLIDGTGSAPLPEATVVVQGARILAAGPSSEIRSVDDPNAAIIDGRGWTILPGMIDTHVHLCFSGRPDHARTVLALERDDDAALLSRSIAQAMEALCAGVTTLQDLGSRGGVAQAARDAIQAGIIPGPRVLAAGVPITTTAGHLYYLGLEADTSDELLKAVRSQVRAGADVIKICATGGNMTPGTNPLAAQYSVDGLRLVVEDAHRLGRRVAAHAIGSAGIRNAIDAGIDSIEHCLWYGDAVGEVDQDERYLVAMKNRGLYAGVPLPGVYRRMLPDPAKSPEENAKGLEQLRRDLRGVKSMIGYGVPFVFSSDAGVRMTRFDEFALSLEVATLGLGLSPLEAISVVTGEAARALGLEKEIGQVKAGYRADLLLVEGDPLTDLVPSLRRVRRVFRDGQLVVRDGHLVLSGQYAPSNGNNTG